jgi:hypothetical protein
VSKPWRNTDPLEDDVLRRLTCLALLGGVLASTAALADDPQVPRTPGTSDRLETVAGLPAEAPPAARRPEPALPRAKGWPFAEAFPRTSGTERLHAGASYWSDFLYDDKGASGVSVSSPIARLAPTDGTYTYADDAAADNGADVFRNAVGVDRDASYWRVDWNTLVDPKVPVAVWALDVNASTQDGVREWPAGVGVRSPGVDRALVVSSRGAWLVDARSGTRTDVSRGLTVDRTARSFVVRVPRTTLPVSGTWRIRLAAGVANEAGDGMAPVTPANGAAPGQPAAYNVSYRSVEQEPQQYKHGVLSNRLGTSAAKRSGDLGNYWMEDHQAEALAEGDVSAFGHDLRWADLEKRTATPEPLVRGWSNRWYVSSVDSGQGVIANPAGASTDLRPNYLGRVQPYGVYVPRGYRPGDPTPLTWMLHSLSVNHNQYGALDPVQVQQTCEDRRSICATTLGRGPDMWYYDEAEVDFWEVWNRLAHTYTLDTERTVLSGFSMGGFGTYKLGLTYPDLFAKGLALAAPPTCGIRVVGDVRVPGTDERCATDGDTGLLVGNARHLPFVIASGVADELVPFTSIVEHVQEFDARGYRYHFEAYPAEGHIPYAAKDAFAPSTRQLGRTTRERVAARIDYTWLPNLSRKDLGLGATGVYWLRDLVPAATAPGSTARVTAHSKALADPVITVHRQESADVPGDPSPAVVVDQTWQRSGFAPRSSALTLGLTGVRSVRVDARRAGLSTVPRVSVDATSNGRATVTFTGLRPGAVLDVKGLPSVTADRSGTARLDLRGPAA